MALASAIGARADGAIKQQTPLPTDANAVESDFKSTSEISYCESYPPTWDCTYVWFKHNQPYTWSDVTRVYRGFEFSQ